MAALGVRNGNKQTTLGPQRLDDAVASSNESNERPFSLGGQTEHQGDQMKKIILASACIRTRLTDRLRADRPAQ